MKPTANTLLITGGGSGIGRELARRFQALGNTVIVAGRTLDTLQETIGERPNMHAELLDVQDAGAIQAFATQVISRYPQLNVLINNAGVMRFEALDTARDLHDAEEQVISNLLGPIRLTNALIEHLMQADSPAVVNVSSGLAFVPRADAPTYSATKAAIHSYSVSMREQLKGRVNVIELVPPAVQTELTPGQSVRDGYQPLDEFMDGVMAQFQQQPVPDEILVQRVLLQRLAEREGRFEATFARINAGLKQPDR